MNRSDWVLLILSSAGERGLTPVQLQKVVFLLQKNLDTKNRAGLEYNFKPYHYGPFDAQIYTDVETLSARGLVSPKKRVGSSWSSYHITERGSEQAQGLSARLSHGAYSYVGELVAWVQAKSFQTLIASIYKKYPEYKVRSIFRSS